MTLVFVSNFYNIHQVPLSSELYKNLGKDFCFIETTPMDIDRKEMGFSSNKPEFVLSAYESEENKKKAIKLINDCDVAIFGSVTKEYSAERLKSGKLTFKYSERYFRGDPGLLNSLKVIIGAQRHIKPLEKCNVYFLCASAYTAQDVNKYADFKDRTLKWGYFRDFERSEPNANEKDFGSILWVARMIHLKHPELAVSLAEKLRDAGYSFTLNMIGDGECYNEISQLIAQKNLSQNVVLLGSKTPNEVQEYMKKSSMFLGTSDFKEGWGMVVNEAMSNGCAVLVSHSTGAAPYLIDNGKNGFIFRNGDLQDLYRCMTQLLDNPDKIKEFGRQAYLTIAEIWNAEVAVKRLLKISEGLLCGGKIDFYADGPCSRAEILQNDWL